ncbi:MAG TPA: chemotaxis protein CheA [Treponemataceae bacterium]|nr:chemotaxis protein CheA [Treponemataceae bacterium]
MSDVNQQFITTFKEESFELLGSLEDNLLELETNPSNKELLSAVFRVMHTIKGSAAMFGLTHISRFAHEVESVLAALRDGAIPLTKDLIGNVLIARDHIDSMLAKASAEHEELAPELVAFLAEMRAASGLPQATSEGKGTAATTVSANTQTNAPTTMKTEGEASRKTWHVEFKPSPSIYSRGINPFTLLRELASLGEAVCIPDFAKVPPIETLNPDDYREGWNIFLTTNSSENRIRDVFIFIEGDCELLVECISEPDHAGADETRVKKLGEILIERGRITEKDLERVLASHKRLGEALVEEKLVSPNEVKVALETQRQLQKIQADKAVHTDMGSIRVKSEKLDELMALVGELVTVHARVGEAASRLDEGGELENIVEQFGRLSESLRNVAMSIRMVPIGPTFNGFRRLVRDLSAELGKEIELETLGTETELDKSVIDKLHDPLVHIVRNSIDHGIETPDVREARGKPRGGKIRLGAAQAGANVEITIEDDGNGLDRAAILEKAIAKGLVQKGQTLPEDEIFRLIMLPGFSTKKIVSAISGRGVGMDVVNRQMEEIGGKVGIESVEGMGTLFTLRIPLTLAIIDGLLVTVGSERFVLPLAAVVGCMELPSSAKDRRDDVIAYQGQLIPYVDLRSFFHADGDASPFRHAVIVTVGGAQYGILVDTILGGNQTVIKPLDSLYRTAKGLSGATILGDGSIALIVDVEQILETAKNNGGKYNGNDNTHC